MTTSRVRTLRFTAVAPQVWVGRYRRVPGETTALHVRFAGGAWWPVVEWPRDDEVAACHMVGEGDVAALAQAVNAGKRALGTGPGGAFLLDEYGRVLVPASDATGVSVVVVGECAGPLRFHNAFAPGEVFDLYDDSGLVLGDPWDRPYVGLQHQLSRYSELYFWEQDSDGARRLEPPRQDIRLIRALRVLRPHGPVRFLVGMDGVVITKVEPHWEPRYVGRVDLATWFPKEVLM